MRKNTTAAELAKRLKVNIKTVYKYTALPRAEYLANAISLTRPWEAQDISRATWYRRGKPLLDLDNTDETIDSSSETCAP